MPDVVNLQINKIRLLNGGAYVKLFEDPDHHVRYNKQLSQADALYLAFRTATVAATINGPSDDPNNINIRLILPKFLNGVNYFRVVVVDQRYQCSVNLVTYAIQSLERSLLFTPGGKSVAMIWEQAQDKYMQQTDVHRRNCNRLLAIYTSITLSTPSSSTIAAMDKLMSTQDMLREIDKKVPLDDEICETVDRVWKYLGEKVANDE